MVVEGGLCVCRGTCMVVGRVCMVVGWGVCGCRGCVWLWGCAWLQGACMVEGGMHGCGEVCVVARGVCVGYDEIRSMSGRYASYWNAFFQV